ncbi:hypothetical protein M407DRAFT_32316 [Tulasnella calospora MUT 4182]|uniref:Protein kinase domain-containing protein n=1 Tax=Tulasnella calospora MUT 4182 TaxID=1051891 RepID=A0A0C3Q474_9AGAM|nr:hypothetical protein M407DRAFT_32316 [Tulasnella calospora MUT 4182]
MSKLRTRFPDLRRRIPVSPQRAADETRLESASANERLDRLSDFRIHTDTIVFTSSKPHGSGGKAEVVKATYKRKYWSDKQEIAVKKLRYYHDVNQRKFGNEFVHEVDIMAHLSHENIIKLIGFVEDLQEGKAWMVLSWEPNGNVSEFLATGEWEIPERLSLIQDTFAGIEYLHTRQPPVCHGDLKSLNILVSASYRAIITDFGSARILKEGEDRQDRDKIRDVTGASAIAPATDDPIDGTEITIVVASSNQLTLTGPAWSLRWAAPEVALGEPQNLASDIWAAGWVMTNKVPFPELNSEGAIVLKVVEGQVPAAREDTQLSQIVRLSSLMTDCWAFDPQNRPNISRCQAELKWMRSIPPLTGRTKYSDAPSAELLYEMGHIHHSQGNYKEAIPVFQQALSAARSAGDQNISGKALCGLGAVYYCTTNYAKAEQYLTQVQDICGQIGNDVVQADALFRLAKVYQVQSKLTQAEESYTRAQIIFSRINHDEGQANTLHGLGNICRERSQYSKAEEFYNQAGDIYARVGDDAGRANTLRRLGSLSQKRSEYIKAEELFNQALDIYSRIGGKRGRANVKQELDYLYHVQGLTTKAAPLFAEARSLYALIGYSEMERACSRWLDVVSKEGDSPTTSLSVPGNHDVPSSVLQQ